MESGLRTSDVRDRDGKRNWETEEADGGRRGFGCAALFCATVEVWRVSEKKRALGFAACAVAGSLWGCGFFFGKIALAEMGFPHMVLYRFLFAMVALLPLLITHRPGLNRREWGVLLVASFLGVPLQFLIQFHGLSLTTVSHASLMVGTMPVILAVGATLFAHERMDAVGWMALAGSTTGAALIALGGKHHAGRVRLRWREICWWCCRW